MAVRPQDDYQRSIRKTQQIDAQLYGQSLSFNTTWGLFSPKNIDEGSMLLLKYLSHIKADARCCDLGCGYGVIGLWLAGQVPQGHVTLLDKDFVAVEYSKKNADTNQLSNVSVQLSNGFADIPHQQQFDLIVSNVPAKVGKEMMSIMLFDAFNCMVEGGELYLVTINGLRQYMKRELNSVFGNYKKIKQSTQYTIHMAQKL